MQDGNQAVEAGHGNGGHGRAAVGDGGRAEAGDGWGDGQGPGARVAQPLNISERAAAAVRDRLDLLRLELAGRRRQGAQEAGQEMEDLGQREDWQEDGLDDPGDADTNYEVYGRNFRGRLEFLPEDGEGKAGGENAFNA